MESNDSRPQRRLKKKVWGRGAGLGAVASGVVLVHAWIRASRWHAGQYVPDETLAVVGPGPRLYEVSLGPQGWEHNDMFWTRDRGLFVRRSVFRGC